jgi:hypothetical protein
MGDNDDLDDWETDAIVPVDAAIGIIPSWLEAALSTEAAGCPLHARAAYACEKPHIRGGAQQLFPPKGGNKVFSVLEMY